MKIVCKCGNHLTKDLKKVFHTEAYDVSSYIEELTGIDGESSYEHKDYSVKEGTFHRWKRKYYGTSPKNVYTVSRKDFVGAEIYDQSQGCCKWDHFEIRCNICNENIGYGGNDCWQDDASFLYARKVKIINE